MDRRRRTIRESLSVVSDGSDEGRVSPSRTTRNAELPELTKKERGVAYSHSVRRACQHRLVQFIPVRKLSLTGAVAASLFIPVTLAVLHYLVFVTGTLDWSGHPMSALLNANSPRSLAAWLSSHLWLLCLASTVLTFRLRKHKLDDYDGEYRLWFWLVFTCIIGSIDSTTRLTELFGAALDRWSQLHVGWSGGAIVQATLATLIGMLGLRLCTELKSVPTSLVLWLVGLVCWAGSAALSQSLLQLEMSQPVRSWLRASLWLGGLTSIWLCSLYFLRATFMEAQKRFLSRALTSANAVPWQQRLRESMPAMPTMPRFGFGKGKQQLDEVDEEQKTRTRRKKRPAQPDSEVDDDRQETVTRRPETERSTTAANSAVQARSNSAANSGQSAQPRSTSGAENEPSAPGKRGWGFGLGKLTLRPPAAKATGSSNNLVDGDDSDEASQLDREYGKKSGGWFGKRRTESAEQSTKTERTVEPNQPSSPKTKRSLKERFAWSRKGNDQAVAERKATKEARRQRSEDQGEETKSKRSWLKLPRPSLPKMSLPKPRLPKLKLPSFRLPPPGESPESVHEGSSSVPSINQSRPLPSTSSSRPDHSHSDEQDSDNARGLSKAERKRLKRLQQENERRAA